MAKILVADDNSNVQKTVALALADLGVEVVAVNNGDAAVRKLADVSPDLVLADIFMPVRNGYEVCEYVKKNSQFSQVPVVLLVGAFDPLDEREAQRVGADGILKKPFVPPDPLVMMVKTLLERTLGDRLVTVGVSKPVVSMQSKAGGVATVVAPPPAVKTTTELPELQMRPPIDRLSFGEGQQPVAFGQFLEAPAKESAEAGTGAVAPVDDEQILTSSRDASLGDPIFWRAEEPEPKTEEENSETAGDDLSALPMRPWKPDEEASARRSEADFEEPLEPFELVRDEEDTGQTSTIVESSPLIAQDAASQALLTVEAAKPEDLAANPIEWMASVPPPTAEESSDAAPLRSAAAPDAAGSDKSGKIDANETNDLATARLPVVPDSSADVVAPVAVSASPIEPQPSLTTAQPSKKPLAQSAEDTAHSIPKQEWTDLAASVGAKSTEPIVERANPSSLPVAQPAAATAAPPVAASQNSAPAAPKPPAQSAEDTAHSIPKQEWTDRAASVDAKSTEPAAEKAKPSPWPVAQPSSVTATYRETASANSAPPAAKPSSQSAEDTAHSIPKQDWTDLAAGIEPKSADPVAEKPKPAPSPMAKVLAVPAANAQPVTPSVAQTPAAMAANAAPESANSAPSGGPDPALVDAVVQRVLDRMRPQVVDIITKEFLRPVVQALVHREIMKR